MPNASEPAFASVRPKAARSLPEAISGRYFFFFFSREVAFFVILLPDRFYVLCSKFLCRINYHLLFFSEKIIHHTFLSFFYFKKLSTLLLQHSTLPLFCFYHGLLLKFFR